MAEPAVEPIDGDDEGTLDDGDDDGPTGPEIPEDFAAEVEAASSDREESEQDTPAAETPEESGDEGVQLGDVYCNALASGAASFRVSYGEAEESRETLINRYEKRASDELQIDEYVNEYCRQHGGIDNLPPGQAIVVFTSVFALIVAAEDPDAVGAFVEDLNGSD